MELFSEDDRLSLIYGKNGLGKSTISKAIRKAKGDTAEDIERADLYDGENMAYSDIQSVHVFNEDYMKSRVKIREDGLNTIVLLGELGNLEDKILDLELRIEAESNRNAELKIVADEYKDRGSKKSPDYCRFQINLGLSWDGHWAEREKIINDGKHNAGVTEKVIDSIIELKSTETLSDLKKRYEETLELLKQVRKNEAAQIRSTVKLNVTYDEKELQDILSQKIEGPILYGNPNVWILSVIHFAPTWQMQEWKLRHCSM